MTSETQELPLSILSLFFIIFIEGFVSISVEILTIRQLIPVVGNSVVVTSLIIGIFLLFLALGYYRGAFYRKDYARILRRNFSISAIILGLGLCYIFISAIFQLFSHLSSNSLITLTLYLLLITAPLIYLLGQTVPITTNLFRFEYHVGSISGRALFISTLGSFLGAVLTALVLMNFFGVAWTIMINFAALFGIMLLVIDDFMLRAGQILLLLVFGVLIYVLNVHLESTLFLKTNHFANYQIKDIESTVYGKGKLLSSNESSSSFLKKDNTSVWYIEKIKTILFKDLALKGKDILVIGAGGFTITAQGDYGNRVVYNDIDADIKDVALSGFINKINGDFVVDDARRLLKETRKKYNVIISDAFTNRITIPFHLLTVEHMQNIRNALRPDGIAIFNIIASATYESKFAKRVDNTIRSVFPSCVVIPQGYSKVIDNLVYVCRKSQYEDDKTIYADNKNTAALDFFTR